MQAGIQWLQPGLIGIVRAGPRYTRYSSPYDYACVFQRSKFRPFKVEMMALVADGKFKTAHRKAIICKVKQAFAHVLPSVFWKRFH